MKFSVPIAGYGLARVAPHAACFVDYVRAVVAALRDLGHEVVRPTSDDPQNTRSQVLGVRIDRSARPIIFGAQNMLTVDDQRDPGSFCPDNAILYNSEQTGARGADARLIFDAVSTWKKRIVWDYSRRNAEVLRRLGVGHVVMCPVAYHPSMTRIDPLPADQEDIDVLFYGSVETLDRITRLQGPGSPIQVLDRGQVLEDLKRAGLKVCVITARDGIYAEALDPYIARAKVVLNLHYYQGAVFEMFRCSHLLANRKCIITEDGGVDEELEDFARKSMIYVPRGDLVEACRMLVDNADLRHIHGKIGYDAFRKTSLTENIRKALEQS